MKRCALGVLIGMAVMIVGTLGVQALDVTSDGTHYTVTAPGLWEMKIRAANGSIWSFKDLADAGNGAGDHFNFMGEDAYNYARTLLGFTGRSGTGVGMSAALPSNGSLGFSATGSDLASFTMTYSETFNGDSGTYLYGGTYADGASSVTNGNVLSEVVMTINDPTPAGTVIDYYVKNMGQRPNSESLSPKYFFQGNASVRSYLGDGRTQAGGYAVLANNEGLNVTRTIEAGSIWATATVDASAINQAADHGLTAGREFRLERTSETAGWPVGTSRLSYNAGNVWATHVPATAPAGQSASMWWAALDGIQLKDSARYNPYLAGDVVKESAGTLTINITSAGPSVGSVVVVR